MVCRFRVVAGVNGDGDSVVIHGDVGVPAGGLENALTGSAAAGE
ncbi:hypothetical protein GT370_07415 [Acidocella sp. MX-AZ03]|nr:hypothetical protein [Acidocella sp. MX-AZ03]WBO60592.1 hypothetical protein GT370_07415 [Acidocella sp. MX-AZ03]